MNIGGEDQVWKMEREVRRAGDTTACLRQLFRISVVVVFLATWLLLPPFPEGLLLAAVSPASTGSFSLPRWW
jgi:hypothetical protein